MTEAGDRERRASSITLRFLDELPFSPALLSVGLAVLLSTLLLLVELWSGRLEQLTAEPDGLRNVRIAVGLIALVLYVPTATLYVIRGARGAVDALRPLVRLEDVDVRALVDGVGTQSALGLRVAGSLGAFLSLLIPVIADLPRGEFPYTLDLPAEVFWHRFAVLVVGWWSGQLLYVIGIESRRLSALAAGLRPIDLFDLTPLLPFARQGLTHALLMIGYISIFAVMSLFEVGLGLAAGFLALLILPSAALGMLMPVRGVHRVIRAEKERRLAWCQQRLRALQGDSAPGPDGSATRELADVLTLRSHVEAVREWPFDVSVLMRLAIYLVIPLASWAGAALVERMVDALLG
jgi:hypothetical protein